MNPEENALDMSENKEENALDMSENKELFFENQIRDISLMLKGAATSCQKVDKGVKCHGPRARSQLTMATKMIASLKRDILERTKAIPPKQTRPYKRVKPRQYATKTPSYKIVRGPRKPEPEPTEEPMPAPEPTPEPAPVVQKKQTRRRKPIKQDPPRVGKSLILPTRATTASQKK